MNGLQGVWEPSGLGKQNAVGFSLEMGSRLLSKYQRPVTQKGQKHSARGICGHLVSSESAAPSTPQEPTAPSLGPECWPGTQLVLSKC